MKRRIWPNVCSDSLQKKYNRFPLLKRFRLTTVRLKRTELITTPFTLHKGLRQFTEPIKI